MGTKLQPHISFENTSVAFSAKNNRELKRMYWLFLLLNNNWLVRLGTFFVSLALYLRLPVRWLIRPTVFNHFCGGESIKECETTIRHLSKDRVGTILDFSVEASKRGIDYDSISQEIIRTIDKSALHPQEVPFCVFKISAIFPPQLLEKKQAQKELNANDLKTWKQGKKRIDAICRRAYERKVRVFIDAEESWLQESIDELAYEMMEYYNEQEPIVYNTYQMYSVQALPALKKALHRAVKYNYLLGVKLVRGAYLEKERKRANNLNYPDPIHESKEATDQDFNRALKFCVENKQRIALCAGTHNEYSTYYLTLLMEKYNVSPKDPNFYFAQLYGMSDHISYNLARAGYNTAKYVPYGPIPSVMPYLFRRAKENTAVAGQSSRELSLIKRELHRRKTGRSAAGL